MSDQAEYRAIPYHKRRPPRTWQEAVPDWFFEAGGVEKTPAPGSLLRIFFPSEKAAELAIVSGEPTFKYKNYNEVFIHIAVFCSSSGRLNLCLKSWFDRDKGDFDWTVIAQK